MALIIDFLLLAASGTACLYCWILSKRLQALTNSKDGIQTGIAALSQSAEDMQGAMAETKSTANVTVSHLEALLAESEKKIPELQELLQQISDISEQAVGETETAARNLVEILSPYIEDAKTSATLLLNSLEEAAQNDTIASKEDKPTENPDLSRNRIDDGGLDIEFVGDDEDEDKKEDNKAA
jgi:ABC-type transporter Mla subunit MlaD